jgi:hypothetical protein
MILDDDLLFGDDEPTAFEGMTYRYLRHHFGVDMGHPGYDKSVPTLDDIMRDFDKPVAQPPTAEEIAKRRAAENEKFRKHSNALLAKLREGSPYIPPARPVKRRGGIWVEWGDRFLDWVFDEAEWVVGWLFLTWIFLVMLLSVDAG